MLKCITLYSALILLIALQSCQKEVSFEGENNTSIFEFESSPGQCPTPIINGSWQVGKPLEQANFIEVPVIVNQTGTWSYAEYENGISLSGAGNFADTGAAIVRLYATGVPQVEGTFGFSLTTSCAINILVEPMSSNPGGGGNSPFYYKATIGGVYYEALVKENPSGPDDYSPGTGMGGLSDVDFSADIAPKTYPIPAGRTSIQVTKGILFDYLGATDATFEHFFAPGAYSYIVADSINSVASGISIDWEDTEGNYWSTKFGTADQTGSTFKIISEEEYIEPSFSLTLKVKMQFTCKLYREDTGEMKQLTNGEMVGLFSQL